MGSNFFSFVFDAITTINTQQGSYYQALGLQINTAFALIVLVLFGINASVSGFDWARFFSLVQNLVLVHTMLTFYTVPIPGLGISFTGLILDQVTAMVAQLDQSRVQEIIEALNTVESALPVPSWYEFVSVMRFIMLVVAILFAQAVTMYVVMYGYVATAVLLLLGPVFIPFKLIPEMDWLFWGWFRAFLQHAFYQVVASAYVFIFGGFLMQFLGMRNGPFSTAQLAYLFVPMVLMLVTFILGLIKVPALTFSLFSGRSGDYIVLRWR